MVFALLIKSSAYFSATRILRDTAQVPEAEYAAVGVIEGVEILQDPSLECTAIAAVADGS
jgi:hypothetical protein